MCRQEGLCQAQCTANMALLSAWTAQCSAVQSCIVQCEAMHCGAAWRSAVQCCLVRCGVVWVSSAVKCSARSALDRRERARAHAPRPSRPSRPSPSLRAKNSGSARLS
eukprot:3565185-Pleurochrysis_carterae.AAC.1